MAEPLTPEEEAAARAVAAHVGGEVWEHSAVASLVARLLATLDAERAAASQGDEGLREALKDDVRALAHLTPEQWAERRGGDPIARTINAVFDIIDARLATPAASSEAASPGDERTPFQRVVDDVTGGCGCACHAGIGHRTSCSHCAAASQGDEGLRKAASEAAQYGSTLASLLTVLPGECQQVGDICVVHNAGWSTRNGADLGHCEWIEARAEIVPEWRSAEHALRAALDREASHGEERP